MQSSFKELLLSEIHSIPHGNQIVVSPSQFNRIFIIGGHFFKKPSNKVYELDTMTSEFVEHSKMTFPRWLHRTVAHKNFIFVSGGVNNDKEIPTDRVILSSKKIFNYLKNELKNYLIIILKVIINLAAYKT